MYYCKGKACRLRAAKRSAVSSVSSPLQLCAILDCGNEKKPSANHCNAATCVVLAACCYEKLNRARRAVQPNKTTDWMVCLPTGRVRAPRRFRIARRRVTDRRLSTCRGRRCT